MLLSIDLMVLPHGFITDLSHRDLHRDDWVCLVSADNPALLGRTGFRCGGRFPTLLASDAGHRRDS
jgi:hypothetical protein